MSASLQKMKWTPRCRKLTVPHHTRLSLSIPVTIRRLHGCHNNPQPPKFCLVTPPRRVWRPHFAKMATRIMTLLRRANQAKHQPWLQVGELAPVVTLNLLIGEMQALALDCSMLLRARDGASLPNAVALRLLVLW